jgi:hypothetical protein
LFAEKIKKIVFKPIVTMTTSSRAGPPPQMQVIPVCIQSSAWWAMWARPTRRAAVWRAAWQVWAMWAMRRQVVLWVMWAIGRKVVLWVMWVKWSSKLNRSGSNDASAARCMLYVYTVYFFY